ncbi:2,3-butanediol dehydrogenase [Thermococcus sp. CX2]|uniref:2,3-butanediol dehydrogenase n=1 Tax=Thermococcus sp. CX2 TaxID=163006 RepID=UPI001439D84D|nr:2,3-butanediol dehydrogenase [Thermococcus sp. CX2]NJE85866.1 2,3-butanediol dehydrogenase [Thermococcus sp. CX2]
MLGLRYYGRGDLRLEEVEEPKIKPGFLKIRVRTCGICGTDLNEYLSGPIFVPKDKPHPLTGRTAPVILGHEFSGEVVEVGAGVKGFKEGDRVAVFPVIHCGECYFCRRGMENLCVNFGVTGLSEDGGFAEYALVRPNQAYKLPESVSFEEGALVEPLSVGVRAVKKAEIMPGDSVVIVGAGPIGLCVLLVAKASGAGKIIVVEPSKVRREKAKELGADIVIDPTGKTTEDVVGEIVSETDIGVDVSFECVGINETFRTAVECLRKGGKAVMLGVFKCLTPFDAKGLVVGEKVITGSVSHSADDFLRGISLISSNRVDVRPLITSRVRLGDIIEKGFEELVKNKEKHVKILATMEGSA